MGNDGKSSSVWSPDEDAELARLQEIHGNRWALVAAELPGKTGQQCAQRWRHKVNPAIKKEKWTPEEDAQVRPSPTRARVLPSRSRSRLGEPPAPAFRPDARSLRDRPRAARASRTPTARDLTSPSLEPTTGERRRGRGSVRVSSDVSQPRPFPFLRLTPPHPPPPPRSQLAKLYEEHGQRWAEIARHLEGRTDQQCMGRWRRHLDPSVKKDAWTDDEDAKLMRLHESLGPRWSNISKMLTGRTAQQCRARWFQLSAAEEEGAEEGTTTVTVTVKSEEGSSRGGKKQRKTPSEPLSPSTPAVTDEDGTVSAIKSEGASSKKRREAAEKAAAAAAAAPKRRRTLKDAVASKSETAEAEGGSSAGSPNLYGNGGGLDMLAMLYSAAVTYEQGFAAAGGNVPAFPSQLYA